MLSLGKFLVTWRYSSLLLKSLWQPQGHCPHVKDISKLKHLMRDCAFVYASFDKGTHRCRVDTNPLYEVPPSSTLSQKCLDHISENFLLPTFLWVGSISRPGDMMYRGQSDEPVWQVGYIRLCSLTNSVSSKREIKLSTASHCFSNLIVIMVSRTISVANSSLA